MTGVTMVTVEAEESGDRLDRWFKRRYAGITHGQLEKLLRTGQVRLDGKRVKASVRIESGQVVRVPPLMSGGRAQPRHENAAKAPPKKRLSERDVNELRDAVLFKDDQVLAINKAAGLAVQGGTGQARHLDALLDALIFDRKERPRLVHRLDKDTSGVLLLARTAAAARHLTAAFRGKDARKVYWAAVAGRPPKARGVIDLPLAKAAGPRGYEKVGADRASGKRAITLYHSVASAPGITWLALMPLTGRTHQLRAHCAALGMPILGDGKYGGKRAFPAKPELPKRLLLHAREIAVPHPDDGTTLRLSAPLPEDMARAWQVLGFVADHGEAAVNALEAYAEGLDLEDDAR